jgi:UDP-N-acetylmuramoyl-tripeptide--D-alanyl-D-alanine ligase
LARLSVADAARAVGGRVTAGDPQAMIDGAAIDSRAVRGGEVFFAFGGAHTDGHRFVADALARGAAAAIVQEEIARPAAGALIRVEDTFTALHDLARFVRARTPERLAGITGSAGKTTTKELLAAILASRFRTASSPGNLNNLYGFPLSLLNVPDGTQWMVAEMGMSMPGELHQLSLLGRPDAAIFTVVRPVHLEFFGTIQAIAEAKSEILAGLAPDGFIVANADDPEVTRIARRHGARVVWYGLGAEHANISVEVRARHIAPEPDGGVGSRFTLEADNRSAEVRLPLHGLYNVENCVAAAACAWALGMPLEEIAAAVGGVKPAAMRGVVHRTESGVLVVDDSYNSNPDAATKALESAAALPAAGRRIALLGDMLELGPEGPRFHREVGERAARLGFTVVGVGELSREMAAGAAATEGTKAVWLPDAAAAADWVAAEVRGGDVVLVKGSRGMGLETVVRRLLGSSEAGGAH